MIDDYGEQPGASRPRYVLAEDEREYIIKGPTFSPDNRNVAANEWIAASLAQALELPVLHFGVFEWRGAVFFGSEWMPPPTFSPAVTEALFAKCSNRDRAYDAVVLDTWLINKDRHDQNLIVRRDPRAPDEHRLLLNDHSHLLVSPKGPLLGLELMAHVDRPPEAYVRLPFIRDAITDPARLRQALAAVEGLGGTAIRGIVEGTPDGFLSDADREVYGEFLTARQARLGGLFRGNAGVFPRLTGTP